MQTISATDFKAGCLDILDRVSRRELDRVVITKRGRPVGVLTPPEDDAEAIAGLYGCMAGSVTISEGVDLTEPALDEALDAEGGVLHR